MPIFRSYYHPANMNNSSEQLHVFIASLCNHFIDRLHLERHNKKWETKVPEDRRLREEDITQFVEAVTPIAWMVLYNNYEEEARSVFSSLALVAPASVIPKLLNTLSTSKDILTEPHRFHVCIQVILASDWSILFTTTYDWSLWPILFIPSSHWSGCVCSFWASGEEFPRPQCPAPAQLAAGHRCQ